MKLILRTLLTIVLMAVTVSYAQLPDSFGTITRGIIPNNDAAEQELRRLVRAWDEATVKRDVVVLDRLLAEEFAFVDGPKKAQYLASITSRPADSTIESAKSVNVEVQIYGDTAIVVGLDIVNGKNKGQAFENRFRYMDVWIKRAGRWQCVKVYSTLSKVSSNAENTECCPLHFGSSMTSLSEHSSRR